MEDAPAGFLDRLLLGNAASFALCVSVVPTVLEYPGLAPYVMWPAVAFLLGVVVGILAHGTTYLQAKFPKNFDDRTAEKFAMIATAFMTLALLGGLLGGVGAVGFVHGMADGLDLLPTLAVR